MAEAERCEVASAEEGRFRGVPRTKEKWLKVFVCFFWQRVLSTVQYLSSFG